RLIQVGRRLGGVLAALRDITGALFLGRVVHLRGDDGLRTELLLLLGEFAAISPFPQLHSRLQALVDLGGNIAQHLNEGIHGISGSEIGEHRATARHPGNTAIVHFFAGRDVPGSAWEGRAPAPPGSSAPAPRHSHPAGIYSHPTRVLLPRFRSCRSTAESAPTAGWFCRSTALGANRASTYSHPGRVLLPQFHSCRSTALGANRASTYSHPGRVLLPRQVPVGAPPSVRTGQAHIRTRGGCSYHGFVPVGAPPSVRTGRAHFRTQRVLLRRAGSVGAPPSVRTGASTFSHPGRVLLPRFRSCRSTALGANRGKHVVRTRGGYSYRGRFL